MRCSRTHPKKDAGYLVHQQVVASTSTAGRQNAVPSQEEPSTPVAQPHDTSHMHLHVDVGGPPGNVDVLKLLDQGKPDSLAS